MGTESPKYLHADVDENGNQTIREMTAAEIEDMFENDRNSPKGDIPN